MPLYSYLCADCGPFDEIRSISAYEEPEPCPQCAASARRTGRQKLQSVGGWGAAAGSSTRSSSSRRMRLPHVRRPAVESGGDIGVGWRLISATRHQRQGV
jgi:putative FmdB family regulatory protein